MIWGYPLEGTFARVISPTLHVFEKLSEPILGFLACDKFTLKHKQFSSGWVELNANGQICALAFRFELGIAHFRVRENDDQSSRALSRFAQVVASVGFDGFFTAGLGSGLCSISRRDSRSSRISSRSKRTSSMRGCRASVSGV